MVWQIFILAFHYAGVQLHGFNLAAFLSLTLQTIYIAKFFKWEAGYFYTLDMMLDRAGYYICWGCLVWVPCLYAYTSNFFVTHRPDISSSGALLVFVLGILAILLNYRVSWPTPKPQSPKMAWPNKFLYHELERGTGRLGLRQQHF